MPHEIQVDQRGFFQGGAPYVPVMSTEAEGDVEIVPLFLGLDAPLRWEFSKARPLFWQLDFGLACSTFPQNSLVALRSLEKGAAYFVDQCLIPHREATLGVALYHGPISKTSVEFLSYGLQQLGAVFPEDIPLFACFDLEQELSATQIALLTGPHYFPYLHIGLTRSCYPLAVLSCEEKQWRGVALHRTHTGLVLPLPEVMASSQQTLIDDVIETLTRQAVSYRLLYESHMSEQWEGLDQLVVFPEMLSEQGKRKTRGFVAAGGRVLKATSGDLATLYHFLSRDR